MESTAFKNKEDTGSVDELVFRPSETSLLG